MKFNDFLNQINELNTSGKVATHNIEVIANDKKYFVSNVDIKSDALKFEVTRNFFHPLSAADLVNKMKDYKNMINDEADCQVIIEGKASEPKALTGLFVTSGAVELLV